MRPPATPDPFAHAVEAPRPAPLLAGLRVLLVEHDYWLAHETAELLCEAGAEVAGPAGRLDVARALVAREPHLDGAVTGVQLGDGRADALIAELLARGVPVLLATGCPGHLLPDWLRALPRVPKPGGRELGRAAAEAFGRGQASGRP